MIHQVLLTMKQLPTNCNEIWSHQFGVELTCTMRLTRIFFARIAFSSNSCDPFCTPGGMSMAMSWEPKGWPMSKWTVRVPPFMASMKAIERLTDVCRQKLCFYQHVFVKWWCLHAAAGFSGTCMCQESCISDSNIHHGNICGPYLLQPFERVFADASSCQYAPQMWGTRDCGVMHLK
jgi:hypothetical protein